MSEVLVPFLILLGLAAAMFLIKFGLAVIIYRFVYRSYLRKAGENPSPQEKARANEEAMQSIRPLLKPMNWRDRRYRW